MGVPAEEIPSLEVCLQLHSSLTACRQQWSIRPRSSSEWRTKCESWWKPTCRSQQIGFTVLHSFTIKLCLHNGLEMVWGLRRVLQSGISIDKQSIRLIFYTACTEHAQKLSWDSQARLPPSRRPNAQQFKNFGAMYHWRDFPKAKTKVIGSQSLSPNRTVWIWNTKRLTQLEIPFASTIVR